MSSSGSSSTSCCFVSSFLIGISSSSFLRGNLFVLVETFFQTRYQIFPSVLHLFDSVKLFPKHFPYSNRLLLLVLYRLRNRLSCHLGSCCYSRFLSLLESRCLARHSFPVLRLSLYTQANKCSIWLCTPFVVLDILQQNLICRVHSCCDATDAFRILP